MRAALNVAKWDFRQNPGYPKNRLGFGSARSQDRRLVHKDTERFATSLVTIALIAVRLWRYVHRNVG